MNKKIKEKWIKALRSNKYKQTSGYLKSENSFCCLGVLCDLYIKETKNTKWELEYDDPKTYHIDHCNGYLPDFIARWADLTIEVSNNPENEDEINMETNTDATLPEPVKYDGKILKSLVGLNDKGMKFKEIAEIIEKQF